MKKFLIIATTNKGKLIEIREILKGIPYEIKSSAEFGFNSDIPETGMTFKENAQIKTVFIGRKTGMMTLAEDSGLEVDYLGGRPGIYSARYLSGTDQDRYNKILAELNGVPREKRQARFVCVAALFDPQKNKTFFYESESRGVITEKPYGKNGFGYDPIFYNLELKKTNAQASSAEKNRVSHRARALIKVKEFLLRHTP